MNSDADMMRQRYDRRLRAGVADLYDPLRLVNIMFRQERERAMLKLLSYWLRERSLSEVQILEIGCGNGGNLLDLIRLGATPENIAANELLEDRLQSARRNLPAGVAILPGNALQIDYNRRRFDLIIQSTVFSSILDKSFRIALADRMTTLLAPGGAILWYDFIYDNPKNKDVSGVSIRELKSLFSKCEVHIQKTTLAPPLARRLGRATRAFYHVLNSVPFLRTHVVALIMKR